jgi:MFS family permease
LTAGYGPNGEMRLTITLAGIIALRMLGLFMILPVFMVLARDTPGFTPLLGGVAVGAYGLTQALFQQPFGWLSDLWGRRRVLLLGMAIFAIGGVVAALAESMTALIIGRCLQGSGAIAGVAMAFAADRVQPERRAISMAIIGMGIGGAFLLSMAISVPVANLIGLQGLFWLTAGLALLGMALVMTTPSGDAVESEPAETPEAGAVVWLLCLSVFLLHAVMTQLFVVLPGLWVDQFHFALAEHWKIYLPAMLVSVLLVLPLLARMGRRGAESRLIFPAFCLLGLALFSMGLGTSLTWLAVMLAVYFAGFNLLEAAMPSMLARVVKRAGRGRRMGLYSTFQFLGAFAGGVAGGFVLGQWGPVTALHSVAVLCLVWGVVFILLSKRVFADGGPE